MIPPSFWYRRENEPAPLLEKLAAPLAGLYQIGHALCQRAGAQEKFGVPVICIGNLNAGGAGKTPSALVLMNLIKTHALARNPFFLSRGYGGSLSGPLLVNPQKHNASETGDEPLLLAAAAPAIVSRDRAAGIKFASAQNADLVIMDDGLQNPDIVKNLSFVVIDGMMGFGNGKTIPAGPLRESIETGLDKADAFILIGEDRRDILPRLPSGKPVFRAFIHSNNKPAAQKYIAFAGIGYPEKFFLSLRELNYNLAEAIPFPDHHPYSDRDTENLEAIARKHGAPLITTEKDFLRLPEKLKNSVHILPVILSWKDEESLVKFLKTRLAS